MEVDIIVLPKDGSKQKLQMGMKQEVKMYLRNCIIIFKTKILSLI